MIVPTTRGLRCGVHAVCGFLFVLASNAATVSRARADSIRDHVRDHVGENLEKEPPKKKKRKASKSKRGGSRAQSSRPRHGNVERSSAEPAAAEADEVPEEPAGPKLPIRVIGKNLQLDPKVGAGFRGWHMQQYPSVEVSAQGYFTWSIDLKAKFFRLVNLHRGYYESNGLSAPRNSDASTAAEIGTHAPKAAWLLGMIGVPITKAWEPIIRYETRAFQTTATPKRPVRIVPHDTDPDTDLTTFAPTTEELTLLSGFETFVAGVRYSHSKDASAVMGSKKSSFPPIYFGLGLTAYRKPYQVTVGDAVLDDVLFDGRFRGAGLAFGVEGKERPDDFFYGAAVQVGLGEVLLLEDLSLNELLPQKANRGELTPPEWLIGYVQGDVTVGYMYPLLRTQPTLLGSLAVNGGGATFFYVETQREEGEPIDAPPLNWDFLWGVRASLILPL